MKELVHDENDNAGMVRVVEDVKITTRATEVPWLIDAHAGKGEDQSDDADPTRALRGASAAAGAADYMLSLRYQSKGTFTTGRRLSGKGRFVNVAPLALDFDPKTGCYTVVGEAKAAQTETTWKILSETGALTSTPETATTIAKAAGIWDGKPQSRVTASRHVRDALEHREGVRKTTTTEKQRTITRYSLDATV